jgi:hypothetical protein
MTLSLPPSHFPFPPSQRHRHAPAGLLPPRRLRGRLCPLQVRLRARVDAAGRAAAGSDADWSGRRAGDGRDGRGAVSGLGAPLGRPLLLRDPHGMAAAGGDALEAGHAATERDRCVGRRTHTVRHLIKSPSPHVPHPQFPPHPPPSRSRVRDAADSDEPGRPPGRDCALAAGGHVVAGDGRLLLRRGAAPPHGPLAGARPGLGRGPAPPRDGHGGDGGGGPPGAREGLRREGRRLHGRVRGGDRRGRRRRRDPYPPLEEEAGGDRGPSSQLGAQHARYCV